MIVSKTHQCNNKVSIAFCVVRLISSCQFRAGWIADLGQHPISLDSKFVKKKTRFKIFMLLFALYCLINLHITLRVLLWNTLLKWQCAILAHSQNPQQPVTLADTYLQISLMVTDIQNISRFGWNLQSFRFSITGAVSVPIFGVPLDLLLQDLWSHYRV